MGLADLLEEAPPEAPVVTPEALSRPFVSSDVRAEIRRVDEEDAARTAAAAAAGAAATAAVPAPEAQPVRAPLLLDVTANTLGVATVGGFVEILIGRNSPVPIEKRHLFTTSADFQDRAVIRVLEGESPKAAENHVLGEVELMGIRQAPRGEVKIEVTYELTVDGILAVSAVNLETGEAQSARLTLFGG
jgi:molecular chaperone DnaK